MMADKNSKKKMIRWMTVCIFTGALLLFGFPVKASIQPPTAQSITARPTTTQPTAVQQPTVTIIMVGDVLLHTRVEQSATTEDGSFDFAPIFANVKEEVAAADLALVNQEVIIGGEELGISGYPAFNAPYEVADELADTGFDVICHATNHALDKGKKGLNNCLNYWQEHYPDLAVLGIHDSKEHSC